MKQLWMVSCVNFVKSIVYVFKISRMFLMVKKKIQEIYLKRTFEIQRILLDKGVIARKNSKYVVTMLYQICSSNFSWLCRSSHRKWRKKGKKSDLKNFTKFTGKHLCQSLFFNRTPLVAASVRSRKIVWADSVEHG